MRTGVGVSQQQQEQLICTGNRHGQFFKSARASLQETLRAAKITSCRRRDVAGTIVISFAAALLIGLSGDRLRVVHARIIRREDGKRTAFARINRDVSCEDGP